MATIRNQTRAFTAHDPQGRSYQILQFTDYERTASMGGTPQDIELLSELVLADGGRHLNYLEHGKYEVVATGIVLTSTDPAAP